MADVAHTKYAIDMIKAFNIPVIIMYNGNEKTIQSYDRAFLARINPADEGTLQWNIILDATYIQNYKLLKLLLYKRLRHYKLHCNIFIFINKLILILKNISFYILFYLYIVIILKIQKRPMKIQI